MLDFQYVTLLESTVITGGEGAEGTAPAAEQQTTGTETAADPNAAEASPVGGLMALLPTLLIYGAVIGGMYLLMFRPQRKREKEMAAMQQAIRTGDNVVTSSGLYGKIVDIGEDVFVVEFGTNRGVRVPVRKTDIVGTKTPKMTASQAVEISGK